jgi:hypothetical protein
MAVTIGFIQRLTVLDSGLACVFIGPSPTNAAALVVQQRAEDTTSDLAWKTSIIDGLATAMANRQPVQVTHGDNDVDISALTLGPG